MHIASPNFFEILSVDLLEDRIRDANSEFEEKRWKGWIGWMYNSVQIVDPLIASNYTFCKSRYVGNQLSSAGWLL